MQVLITHPPTVVLVLVPSVFVAVGVPVLLGRCVRLVAARWYRASLRKSSKQHAAQASVSAPPARERTT